MSCKPLICGWADRRQAARTVFLVVLAITAVSLTSLIFVPPLPGQGDVNATWVNASGKGDASDPGGGMRDLRHYQFWLYTVLVLVAWMGTGVNHAMADGMTATVAERLGADFGRQRLWGTVGYSTMSTFSGFLIEQTSGGGRTNYSTGYYLAGAFLATDVILSSFFFKVPTEVQKRNTWSETAAALRHWPVFCFAGCCAAVGICTGLLWSFHIWYLEDLARTAGYPKSRVQMLEGLTLLVKGLGCEIPLMFMSGAILRKIGHRLAMVLSMASLGLYCVLYAQLVDPWYCLLMEPLAGAGHGLLYPAMASYARSIAPAGSVVSTQGIMAASYDGLGVGVGTLLSAYVFARYGGSVTFLAFGVGMLVAAVMYWAVSCLVERLTTRGTEPVIVFDDTGAIAPTESQVVLSLTKDGEVPSVPALQDEKAGAGRVLPGEEDDASSVVTFLPEDVPCEEERK